MNNFMDAQAVSLNNTIEKQNNKVLEMLSERGKNIFFPKQGILAQSAQAKGKNINATIGEAVEDDGSSMHLSEFDNHIGLQANNVFPYAPSFGKKDLRDTWKKFIYEKNPSLEKSVISLPIATNGITHGLSIAGYLFADEADSVIISNLFWENYNLIFENGYGANVQYFDLFKNGGFNVNSFSEKINEITREKVIMLLNFPNNPSGYTPLDSEVEFIVKEIYLLAEKGKRVVVLIDDAYFGLVYEDKVFKESIFTRIANLHENVLAVKFYGANNEYFVGGYRVG